MDLDLCLGPQRQKSSWNGESGEAEGRNLAALDKPTHGNKAQLSSPPKQCRRGKKINISGHPLCISHYGTCQGAGVLEADVGKSACGRIGSWEGIFGFSF